MRDVTGLIPVSSLNRSFLLTRPMRDVTKSNYGYTETPQFLLTRPMRDVTEDGRAVCPGGTISTHTSHAGRDDNCKK